MSQAPLNGSETLQSGAAPPRRVHRSRASYPRKRAIVACEACRKRKIKCDNERPICGGCMEVDIPCTFQNPKADHSKYDLASLEILERINYVATLLETQRDAIPEHISRSSLLSAGSPTVTSPIIPKSPVISEGLIQANNSVSCSEDHISNRDNHIDPDGLLESLEFTGLKPGGCEEVLNWHIFEGHYDNTTIMSSIFNPQISNNGDERFKPDSSAPRSIRGDQIRTSGPGRGIMEDDILHLIDKFLVNVHIKNPVLDLDDLKVKAKQTAEHGFGWDATSCLILVVCALASLSSSFRPDPVTPDLVEGAMSLNGVEDTQDYTTAESYYVASQKRIGILDNSLETTQCYFLTGVYEMYSLRPAKAWTSFNRACITLQIYFRGQGRHELVGSKDVVSRLYWSCLKAECELRMEMNLPPSGLANVAYPDAFPTPPSPGNEMELSDHESETRTDSHRESFFARHSELDLEMIWSYYLSELAVRRIANRIMNCFYRSGENSWLTMPIDRMIRVAEELELQISQWFDNLPNTLKTANTSGSRNSLAAKELQFVLHARLPDLRERIYRPFLYLAINHPADDFIQQKIALYAQRCIEACMTFLLRGTPRHRHHGTWYENRGMFLKSLLVIAAAKSGKLQLPDLWQQGVDLCVAGFKFWENESPDLKESRLVLESLLEDLHRQGV